MRKARRTFQLRLKGKKCIKLDVFQNISKNEEIVIA